MPQIIVKQAFKFAHHGYQVEEFEPSADPRETTEEVAELAIKERWARRVKDAAPQKEGEAAVQTPATADAAPENTSTAPAETASAPAADPISAE